MCYYEAWRFAVWSINQPASWPRCLLKKGYKLRPGRLIDFSSKNIIEKKVLFGRAFCFSTQTGRKALNRRRNLVNTLQSSCAISPASGACKCSVSDRCNRYGRPGAVSFLQLLKTSLAFSLSPSLPLFLALAASEIEKFLLRQDCLPAGRNAPISSSENLITQFTCLEAAGHG